MSISVHVLKMSSSVTPICHSDDVLFTLILSFNLALATISSTSLACAAFVIVSHWFEYTVPAIATGARQAR